MASLVNSSLKTIKELSIAVNNFMRYEVDGDMFANEQDFENAVRTMLEQEGFVVLEKHNVENTRELVERHFSSDVNLQIPDISVQCKDGLVFLELKFKNTPNNYQADEEKISNYLKEKKCVVAGVLFLDEIHYKDWVQCQQNKKYYYYWQLYK